MAGHKLKSCRLPNGRTRRTLNAASASTDIARPDVPRSRPRRRAGNPAISSSPTIASTVDFSISDTPIAPSRSSAYRMSDGSARSVNSPSRNSKSSGQNTTTQPRFIAPMHARKGLKRSEKPFAINFKMRDFKAATPRTTELRYRSAPRSRSDAFLSTVFSWRSTTSWAYSRAAGLSGSIHFSIASRTWSGSVPCAISELA